ncbi:MAG: peptide chain release factor N(5)-glutamine methyltransferase [Opitutales bacterium]
MLTIREIQQKTIGYFTGKGVPNAKLETDLLIAHVLGLKRLELYLDIQRPLTEAQLDTLRPLVKRRAAREPLQYILGYSEFCGMRLKVTPATLIPRQETEELVELLRERIATPPKKILDLGTGSGALAIALAALYPEAEVTATDQSTEALAVAQENARTFVSEKSIHFKQGSWFDCIGEQERFDLIVANPPYLTEAEMQSAEPEVAGHEPIEALVAGHDGLDDLKTILAGAGAYLNPGGLLALETGIEQHTALRQLAQAAGLKGEGHNDLSGRQRFYFAQ